MNVIFSFRVLVIRLLLTLVLANSEIYVEALLSIGLFEPAFFFLSGSPTFGFELKRSTKKVQKLKL